VTGHDVAQLARVQVTAASMPALRVEALHKRYNGVEALAGLTFDVQQGEVFGLLGPNGAGKTTTINVIATLMRPSAGDVFVFGHSVRWEPAAVRPLVGVALQDVALYPNLTATENLRFLGRMYGMCRRDLEERVHDSLTLVGLQSRRGDRVATLSNGMKRRLSLAAAILHRPRLVLLDEATVGIDPHSREDIVSVVCRLRGEGVAILYTSHYLAEAERVCDRVAIMDEGRILAMGTLDALLAGRSSNEIVESPRLSLEHLFLQLTAKGPRG